MEQDKQKTFAGFVADSISFFTKGQQCDVELVVNGEPGDELVQLDHLCIKTQEVDELKEDDEIKVHIFGASGKEIETRNYGKVFRVQRNGHKLGINWRAELGTDILSSFTPFSMFSSTVLFEKVKTGHVFHFRDGVGLELV